MQKPILWLVIVGFVVVVGGIIIYANCCTTKEPPPPQSLPLTSKFSEMQKLEQQATPEKKSETITPPQTPPSPSATNPSSPLPAPQVLTPPLAVSFTGTVLAGNQAKVIDFNQTDYNNAVAKKKLVVLYFYANWCPICKAEVPQMYEAFNSLSTSEVVAFRVNYNDNETDGDEEALARANGVAYQHTKVFLKNGQRVLKSPESWDKDRYLTEINSSLGQ